MSLDLFLRNRIIFLCPFLPAFPETATESESAEGSKLDK